MRIFDRRALRRTTWRHWLVAVMLAIVGLIAGEYPWLTSVRHVAYAIVQKAIQRPDADIVVVLIGDDEYNGPRLQNRVPLRRDYLADLITKIRAGNPRAIAVDVDLHSPDPARAMIQPDYVAETTKFFNALRGSADASCPIFLAATMRWDAKQNHYLQLANIFDNEPLGAHVHKGYILLPVDIRHIPPPLKTVGGSLNSLSGRMAEVTRHRGLKLPTEEHPLFAVFRRPSSFETHYAADVLGADNDKVIDWFAHQYVFVGGDWSKDGDRNGPHIDDHATPAGNIAGVFVHANYLQSLIGGPIGALSEFTRDLIEVVAALAVSFLFVAARGIWKFVFIVVVNVGLVVLTYTFLDVLGVFFEAVVPITLLGGHVIVEAVLDRR